jgi:cytidine deaminase
MGQTQLNNLNNSQGPELIIGIVSALGTDMGPVRTALNRSLSAVEYKTERIHLIELVQQIPQWSNLPESPIDERYNARMNAGTELREAIGRGDALGLLGIGAIREMRLNYHGNDNRENANKPIPRQAYIFESLKHPDEVHTLRRIYGDAFILLACYSPRETRLQSLAGRIAESHHAFQIKRYIQKAGALLERDETEVGKKLGQNVSETFPLADVFVNVSDAAGLQSSVNRFIEMYFGNTFHTPSRDEYGMFHAKAAALRSASLARQVGAVISTKDGDIIAVGTNEVPKAGGGLYWCDDKPDYRDFNKGYDTSDNMRRSLLADLLKRLQDGGWLEAQRAEQEINSLVEEALAGDLAESMKSGHFMNLIEFVRAVHAEMSALTDAARRGVSVKDGILFTTTFPCHDCAKHIVAAGIKRVVYIEPYPKSLATEFYPDSIAVDKPGGCGDYVHFDPFVGVAPRRYMDLFEMVQRKYKNGKVKVWDNTQAFPRLPERFPSSFVRVVEEEREFTQFEKVLVESGLKEETEKGETQ